MSEKKNENSKPEFDGYIDRLAATWPEPREQLHFGGWQASYDMAEALRLDSSSRVLDICCGEGETAIWLCKTYGLDADGVDLDESAIACAREKTAQADLSSKVHFHTASLEALPLEDASFDYIIGQDPDGIANQNRLGMFEELHRVLKEDGQFIFQLWLPHHDVPANIIEQFERLNIEARFPDMVRLSLPEFLSDLEQAGFCDIGVEDLSDMYSRHIFATLENFEKKRLKPDAWTVFLGKTMKSEQRTTTMSMPLMHSSII